MHKHAQADIVEKKKDKGIKGVLATLLTRLLFSTNFQFC